MTNISIIVPIYNVELSIRKCIESIIEQECENLKIECILVDDCSPDNSMNIIKSILNNYEGEINFCILRHKTNKGLSCSRNTGFNKATGEYVMFVDSDDYLLPNSIRYFFLEMKKYQPIDIVIGNHFDEKNQTNHFPSLKENLFLSNNKEILNYAYEDRLGFYAWNKIVRRSLIVNNNISFIEGQIFEDILWSVAVYQAANTLLVLPTNTYIYKFNPSSIMHTISNKADKTVNSLTFICNKLIEITPSEFSGKCCIFTLRLMTKAVDIAINNKCEKRTIRAFKATRKKLHYITLKRINIVLALFYLTLYWPIKYIQKLSIYRHNYYRISRILYKLTR